MNEDFLVATNGRKDGATHRPKSIYSRRHHDGSASLLDYVLLPIPLFGSRPPSDDDC